MFSELPLPILNASFSGMLRTVVMAALALSASVAEAHSVAPLYNPIALNVGINCQWQQRCERRQLRAMRDARTFIARSHPPLWRIHLCNRNARRSAARVDWVGFNGCIRNPYLRPPARTR
jgi:hypothetical protein